MGFSCFYGLQPGLLHQVTEWPGDVCGAVSVAYFTYSFFAELRYWKRSKSQWVIADNCIQPCLAMKTAFLGFLPTIVGCEEKMLWALQMIWPYSGLVLVLYVIEKSEFFWLSNDLANFAPGVCTILCCFYTPFMNLWFYVYNNMWRKMLKTSFLINMLG